jgi:FAD/FMN-containing dehydrogenase
MSMIYTSFASPELTTYELQQAVEKYGLLFPPDPASYKDSFIGGNIAENAGGMRTPKYGVTKHSVLGWKSSRRPAKLSEPAAKREKRRRFRFDRLDVRLGRNAGNYHRSDFETFADARSDFDRSRFFQNDGRSLRSFDEIYARRLAADGDGSH